MNNIQNANILITNIEAKMASTGNMKYTITDGEKRKFSFFQNKQDGTAGSVYTSFNSMGLKVGDTAHIGFIEEEDSFTNQKGENIKYMKRNIVNIMEAHGSPKTPMPNTLQNVPVTESKEEYGKRLAIHGFINGLLGSNKTIQEVIELLPQLFLLEQKINEYLAKPESMVIAEAKIKTIPHNVSRSDINYPHEPVEEDNMQDLSEIPF